MTPAAGLDVRPLTPERWPDLVALFERRGPRGGYRNAPGYGCWCMYWRDRSVPHSEPKKQALEQLVRDGRETGLVAYDGDEPVGWVAVAPRPDYAVLLRSPHYRPRDTDEDVWSIVCFLVDRDARGRGVAAALLEAAVAHAAAAGAARVEAYGHTASNGDYMGGLDLYRAHGFEPVREAGKRTVVSRPCR